MKNKKKHCKKMQEVKTMLEQNKKTDETQCLEHLKQRKLEEQPGGRTRCEVEAIIEERIQGFIESAHKLI